MAKRIMVEVKKALMAQPVKVPLEVWDIGGKFVLPGTRKTVTLSPIRVIAENRTKASADMVGILAEKYSRDLPEGQKFSPHFAIYHLKWERFQKKAEAGPTKDKQSCEGVPDGTHCGSVHNQEHALKEVKALP